MKKSPGQIAILLLVICGIGIVSAAEETKVSTEYIWNGTWSSPDYTVYIIQNESGISGAYVPADLEALDPGRLEGNLSEDTKTYSGVWIETGSHTYTLADDTMSFVITGTLDPQGPMTKPAPYTRNATRVGEIPDSENPWTGNWDSGEKSYSITQDGTTLTGVSQPLTNVNDEVGIFEGTVFEDGTVYTGTWIEKGGFSFAMADDGSFINATITKSLEPTAIVEHMIFSR